MPLLWRYLLAEYLKVLLLCVAAFITILITTRLNEIASFATLGSEGIYVLYFTLYQIPYVLPIALPISALISSMILVQRLSSSHELTAFRAAGLSLRDVCAPILLAAAFLSVANFYVVSEMATNSHLSTSLLKNELRSINPLLLLNNKHLMKVKGIFYDTLGQSKLGESASQMVIAMPDKHRERLNLMIVGNMQAMSTNFSAEQLTFVSSGAKNGTQSDYDQHDSLIVENIAHAATSIQDFSQMIQNKVWTLNNDHLQLSLLLARLGEYNNSLEKSAIEGKTLNEQKTIKRSISRVHSEIIRRLSLSIALFTFTLMGLSFGISIKRQKSNGRLAAVLLLAAFYMGAFFSAKGVDHLFLTSTLMYLVPHAVIVCASLYRLSSIARGIG